MRSLFGQKSILYDFGKAILRKRPLGRVLGKFLVTFFLFILWIDYAWAGGAYSYQLPKEGGNFDVEAMSVIGALKKHAVKDNETFLDIARQFGLGFNEIIDLYPQQDPWIPPVGMEVIIPSQWILPDIKPEGIVINIPEFRLYYFMEKIGMVKTCPIGIGRQDWQTPIGMYQITEKKIKPTWFIPPSLQGKYGIKTMAPGPNNPLGDYWIGLGKSGYGIHSTDIPWSIGRLATHGCIRLYPEDMEQFFELAEHGTAVEIVYEPVKIGLLEGKIYVEVHKDIYNKIEDFISYGYHRLAEKGLIQHADMKKFYQALDYQNGLPIDITLYKSPINHSMMTEI